MRVAGWMGGALMCRVTEVTLLPSVSEELWEGRGPRNSLPYDYPTRMRGRYAVRETVVWKGPLGYRTAMTVATALQKQIERYRAMTGEERLSIALRLQEMSCDI